MEETMDKNLDYTYKKDPTTKIIKFHFQTSERDFMKCTTHVGEKLEFPGAYKTVLALLAGNLENINIFLSFPVRSTGIP